VNEGVLMVWAKILTQIPHASLVLKARGMRDERVQARLLGLLKQSGVHESRVCLKAHELSQQDHLASYRQIDLALDTFPYTGTTTTCEALWMGVPIITLAGERHAGRVGVSLLSSVGYEEGIALSIDDYVDRAVRLASDLPRLSALREGMRERMLASPLMDRNRLTRGIEKAIRQAWMEFCLS
jgi:predicted O-linked N-acetylglucosamine transferase (SPINDLY family)